MDPLTILSTIVATVQLLKEVADTMGDNQVEGVRLIKRIESLLPTLKQLSNDDPTPEIEKANVNLLDVTNDAKSLFHAFKEKSFYRKLDRMFSRSEWQKEFANINLRLTAIGSDLNLAITILGSLKERRDEDLSDLKESMKIMTMSVLNDFKYEQHANNDVLNEIKEQLNQHYQQQVELIVEMNKYPPLEKDDLLALSSQQIELQNLCEEQFKHVVDAMKIIENELHALTDAVLDQKSNSIRKNMITELTMNPNRIVIKGELAVGGFGKVCLGLLDNRSKVAVKIFENNKGQCNISDIQKREIENEVLIIRHVSQIPSPYILSMYGFIHDDLCSIIVFELAAYGSLWDILNNRKDFPSIPTSLLLAWSSDLAHGIAHIHDRRVRHKDLKALNMLVYPGLTAKICDFGLAKESQGFATAANTVVGGTLAFMAPEVRNGKKSSFQSDIFSMAMTFLQILTRENPKFSDWSDQIERTLTSVDKILATKPEVMKTLRTILEISTLEDPAARPSANYVAKQIEVMISKIKGDPRIDIESPDYPNVEKMESRLNDNFKAKLPLLLNQDAISTHKETKSILRLVSNAYDKYKPSLFSGNNKGYHVEDIYDGGGKFDEVYGEHPLQGLNLTSKTDSSTSKTVSTENTSIASIKQEQNEDEKSRRIELEELQELKASIKVVLKKGYSIAEIFSIKGWFTLQDFITAGCTWKDLYDSGAFTLQALKDAGCPGYTLKSFGVTVKQLKDILGYQSREIFTALEMRNDFGKNISELSDMGYSVSQLVNDGKFSWKELFDSGKFSFQDFKKAGCTVLDLKSIGYSLSQIRKDGQIRIKELYDSGGYTMQDFRKAGCIVKEMHTAGCSFQQLRSDGQFSLKELYDSGCYTILDFKNQGCTLNELCSAGFSAAQLRKEGFSWKELYDSNCFTVPALLEAGCPPNEAVKVSGYGKYTLPNGDIYEGDWNGDKRTGKGKMTYISGQIYEGDWKDDKRVGRGKLTLPNGQIYEGDWKDDKRNGQGKLTWPRNQVYEGAWTDDVRNGRGKMTYYNGQVYEGNWKNDKRNGNGKNIWPTDKVYEGGWKDYFFRKYTMVKGDIYEGNWEGDMKNGRGKMIYGNGQIFEGNWKNDKRFGNGKLTWLNGKLYEGEFINDMISGHGKMTYENGQIYQGDWKDDKRNGRGKLDYGKGNVYEGDWKNDKRNGRAIFKYADGTAVEGDWRDDKMFRVINSNRVR